MAATVTVQQEPTLELGLTTYLTGLDVAGRQSLAVVRLGTDLQDLVTTHGAVIRVRVTGGAVGFTQDRYRLAVEVYAATYTDVWNAAAQVERRLLRPHFNAGGYIVDYAENESASNEQPHTNLRLVAQVWRLVTRTPRL